MPEVGVTEAATGGRVQHACVVGLHGHLLRGELRQGIQIVRSCVHRQHARRLGILTAVPCATRTGRETVAAIDLRNVDSWHVEHHLRATHARECGSAFGVFIGTLLVLLRGGVRGIGRVVLIPSLWWIAIRVRDQQRSPAIDLLNPTIHGHPGAGIDTTVGPMQCMFVGTWIAVATGGLLDITSVLHAWLRRPIRIERVRDRPSPGHIHGWLASCCHSGCDTAVDLCLTRTLVPWPVRRRELSRSTRLSTGKLIGGCIRIPALTRIVVTPVLHRVLPRWYAQNERRVVRLLSP